MPDPGSSETHEPGSRLPQRSLAELIEAIASDAVAPGAGAAGAMALALAAACAAKAVKITLRHHPGDASLPPARERLLELARGALIGADEDATHFEAFMHEKDRETAVPLVRSGERLQQAAATLDTLLRELEASLDPRLRGDLLAAQALCRACLAIVGENLDENQRAAAALASRPDER